LRNRKGETPRNIVQHHSNHQLWILTASTMICCPLINVQLQSYSELVSKVQSLASFLLAIQRRPAGAATPTTQTSTKYVFSTKYLSHGASLIAKTGVSSFSAVSIFGLSRRCLTTFQLLSLPEVFMSLHRSLPVLAKDVPTSIIAETGSLRATGGGLRRSYC
jgi:hypothetical protein